VQSSLRNLSLVDVQKIRQQIIVQSPPALTFRWTSKSGVRKVTRPSDGLSPSAGDEKEDGTAGPLQVSKSDIALGLWSDSEGSEETRASEYSSLSEVWQSKARQCGGTEQRDSMIFLLSRCSSSPPERHVEDKGKGERDVWTASPNSININNAKHRTSLVFFSKPISVASDCNATPSCSVLIFSM
jgi:hypothetical protein